MDYLIRPSKRHFTSKQCTNNSESNVIALHYITPSLISGSWQHQIKRNHDSQKKQSVAEDKAILFFFFFSLLISLSQSETHGTKCNMYARWFEVCDFQSRQKKRVRVKIFSHGSVSWQVSWVWHGPLYSELMKYSADQETKEVLQWHRPTQAAPCGFTCKPTRVTAPSNLLSS